MANPNPEIWGTPDTWVNDYIIRSNDFPQYKAGKPKNAAFRSLMNGNTQNKTPYPEPIDKTICPCGQDSAVSCFGKILTMSGDSVDDNNNFTPETTIEFETPVNWCFSSGSPATQGWEIRNGFNSVYPPPSTWRWSPNTGELDTSANRNAGVMPFVFYQLKSLLLSIQVLTVDGHATAEYGNTPTNNTGWKTLAEWKNSYSNKSIYSIRFNINWCTSANDTDIVYSGDTQTMGSFDTLQVSLLDGVNLLSNSAELYYDYATYQMQAKNNSFYLTNVYTSPRYTPTRRYYLLSADKFENTVLHSTRGTSNNYWSNTWYEIPYSENNYETIMKMVACFGCPFTDTNKLSFRQDYTDTELCLPVIDSDGITHGEYTRGTANTSNDIYNADSVRDKNYDPAKPPKPTDPNTYSITTGFNTVGAVASTTKAYVVNGAALIGLSGELWSIVGDLITNPEDISNLDNLSLDAFLTSNPIDAIVSVKKFPLLSVPHGENLINVKLGKYTTSAGGYDLAMQQARYNFTGIPIFPKFGNCFLDYSPYTKMQLYVPFCGTIDIDAADFMGRTLSVEMCIDFTTGAVTAYVLANQLVVTSLTGNCAVDIPITGTEQATINSALESATIAERQARHKTIMTNWGVITHPIKTFTSPLKTLSSTIDPALNLAQREYELTHINTPLRQIGQASPLNAWELEFVCRLIIYYPDGECIQFNATNEPSLIDAKVQAFGAVNGFATVETDTLSNFTGFTQVSDADLTGVSATDTEKGMILNLLQTGVYI